MAEINSAEAVLTNTELLTQILTRVPSKPLIAFKIVAKHWLSLISDSHFLVNRIRYHLTVHPPSSLTLFGHETSISINKEPCICTEVSSISINSCLEGIRQSSPIKDSLEILSYCNGLILFSRGNWNLYIVFNPTTQKHRLIPRPLGSVCYLLHLGLGIVLAFEPLKSFHYKIVHFGTVSNNPVRMVDINIFSSETGAWKEIRLQDPPGGVYRNTRMIFWNGAIHWIAKMNIHVSFVADEEKFTWDRISTNPHTFPKAGEVAYFGKTDNGLLLIKVCPKVGLDVLTLFEMDKDNHWSLKHQVNLKPLVSKHFDLNRFLADGIRRLKYCVLHVQSGIKNGDFSMVLAIGKNIILYEMGNGMSNSDCKVLREVQYNNLAPYHDLHPFIECLVPVL